MLRDKALEKDKQDFFKTSADLGFQEQWQIPKWRKPSKYTKLKDDMERRMSKHTLSKDGYPSVEDLKRDPITIVTSIYDPTIPVHSPSSVASEDKLFIRALAQLANDNEVSALVKDVSLKGDKSQKKALGNLTHRTPFSSGKDGFAKAEPVESPLTPDL